MQSCRAFKEPSNGVYAFQIQWKSAPEWIYFEQRTIYCSKIFHVKFIYKNDEDVIWLSCAASLFSSYSSKTKKKDEKEK